MKMALLSAAAAENGGFGIFYAIESVAAVRRLLKSADYSYKCGFSRTVATDKAVDRAFRYPHCKSVQSGKAAVSLGHGVRFKHKFHK